jgi:hypothetical protein
MVLNPQYGTLWKLLVSTHQKKEGSLGHTNHTFGKHISVNAFATTTSNCLQHADY